MFKLNRTTEYGLMALSYIRMKSHPERVSAREIATHYGLPFEILAKTLQRLKEQKVIESTHGTRGGYELSRDLNQMSLAEFLEIMEGPVGLVSCNVSDPSHHNCEYKSHCSIRPSMKKLNERLAQFLQQISVGELIANHAPQTGDFV